jgi:hypothetical protein
MNKNFIWTSQLFIGLITLATAISLAATAALFSISGLVMIFQSEFVSILIMSITMEVAKVSSTTYLHSFWKTTSTSIRIYLVLAVIVVSTICSSGIFSYLISSYIKTTAPLHHVELQVQQIDEQISQQNNLLTIRKQQINNSTKQINQMDSVFEGTLNTGNVADAAANRNRMKKERSVVSERITQIENEIISIQEKIAALENKKSEVRVATLDIENKVAPIKYIAEVYNDTFGDKNNKIDTATAVRVLVLVLVCVFDPLGLVLILASLHAFDQHAIRVASIRQQQKIEDTLKQQHDEEREEIIRKNNIDELYKKDTVELEKLRVQLSDKMAQINELEGIISEMMPSKTNNIKVMEEQDIISEIDRPIPGVKLANNLEKLYDDQIAVKVKPHKSPEVYERIMPAFSEARVDTQLVEMFKNIDHVVEDAVEQIQHQDEIISKQKSSNILNYRGYYAEFGYDQSANSLHGRVIGLDDVIDFYGRSIDELNNEFRNSIDEYIDFKENDVKNIVENVVDVPKNVVENVVENIEKNIPEHVVDAPENVKEDVPEDIVDDVENVVENVKESVVEDIPENVPENIEENVEKIIEENVLENILENVVEDIPENVVENIPENIEEDISENVVEDIPENVVEDIEENVEENSQEDIPENIQEDTKENTSEITKLFNNITTAFTHNVQLAAETMSDIATGTIIDDEIPEEHNLPDWIENQIVEEIAEELVNDVNNGIIDINDEKTVDVIVDEIEHSFELRNQSENESENESENDEDDYIPSDNIEAPENPHGLELSKMMIGAVLNSHKTDDITDEQPKNKTLSWEEIPRTDLSIDWDDTKGDVQLSGREVPPNTEHSEKKEITTQELIDMLKNNSELADDMQQILLDRINNISSDDAKRIIGLFDETPDTSRARSKWL